MLAISCLNKDLPSSPLSHMDSYFYKLHKLGLLILASVSLFLFQISPILCSKKCHYPAIFNFGDSNSDTGGLSAAFGQAPFPNGETYFHYPAGRYCNGRLIIDFIAESLELPFLNAYLDSIGSNFSYGANFATAGSTIRPQNTTMSQSGYSPISLDVQSVQFSDFHRRSLIIREQGRVFSELLPNEEHFSQALYTFDIGQNDLTAGYKLNMTTEQVKAYIPDLMAQFAKTIKNVYAQGGRFFFIHNTGPVGCLPYVIDRDWFTTVWIDKYGCVRSPFNEVAQYFNTELKEKVYELRKALPLAVITYVDMYSVKYTLITEAKKLGDPYLQLRKERQQIHHVTQMAGFEDPFLACCGHGGKYNYDRYIKCGSKKMINGEEIVIAKSCKDPTVRINWDGTHFTEAANRWIFKQIVNGSYSDPPVPLKFTCNRV